MQTEGIFAIYSVIPGHKAWDNVVKVVHAFGAVAAIRTRRSATLPCRARRGYGDTRYSDISGLNLNGSGGCGS
jgi:hypothetical protein